MMLGEITRDDDIILLPCLYNINKKSNYNQSGRITLCVVLAILRREF
jgi:hypothetical protein